MGIHTGTPHDSSEDLEAGAEFREQCSRVVRACEELHDRYADKFFDRPVDKIAAVMSEIASVRAQSALLEGRQSADVAGDRARAEFRDRQIFADEGAGAVDELLQAVERAWAALSVERAQEVLAHSAMEPYRHYLSGTQAVEPYVLSEDAEAALAAREATANDAWVQLYYRVMTSVRPVIDGTAVSMEEARSKLELSDGPMRKRALEAIYDALEPASDVLAHCFDSLVADRLAVDGLRELPYPRAERDLTSELPATVVNEMLSVSEEHYYLPQRWFARKAKFLGDEKLSFSDMRAPVGEYPPVPLSDALNAIIAAFSEFTPEAGQMVRAMAEQGAVDAEARDNKQPGAFCWGLGPGQLPRIGMSYLGTMEDIIALAHEFGHALHFTLSGQNQNGITFDPPLALTEVAPAFAEFLVVDWLMAREPSPDNRNLLAAKRADTTIEAIFSSTFLTTLETRAHEVRASGAALTSERIQGFWDKYGADFYGPGVDRPQRWGMHWLLVPHLIYDRFYCYMYAFSRLVALELYAAYREAPESTRPRILQLLGHGSSVHPVEQLARAGVDISDSGTWRRGMAHFARLLEPLL